MSGRAGETPGAEGGAVLVQDRLFVGGQWVPPATGATIDVVSPYTERVVARVPGAAAADVDQAVAAARAAFDGGPWPRTPPDERADVLQRAAALGAGGGALRPPGPRVPVPGGAGEPGPQPPRPRAGGRGRRHRPMEHAPAGHDVEGCPGARGGLHGRREAGAGGPARRQRDGGGVRRRRPAARRAQRPAGGAGGGGGTWSPPRGRQRGVSP